MIDDMKCVLLLLIFYWSVVASAQVCSTGSGNPLSVNCEAYTTISHFAVKRSFGIYPEVQGVKSPVIGMSASYARLKKVEWTSFNRGVNLGWEFDPVHHFYGPKTSVWSDVFALFIGGNLSMSAMYYFQEGRSGLFLRPEIGIGIPRLHLKYGFGFRVVGDQINGFQRHTLTLGYHLSFVKRNVIL